MHEIKFVSLIKVPLLDVVSDLELYHVSSLPVVIPFVNIRATYDLKTYKFAMSKYGLRYVLSSEADFTKCILASNHFVNKYTTVPHKCLHIMHVGIV